MRDWMLSLPALGLLLLCGASCTEANERPTHTINALIGDQSYMVLTGERPSPELDEDDRIQIHLAYVESLLRQESDAHLSPALREARARNLEGLRAYIAERRFPRNDDHPDPRRPTFVDDEGNICAVGHLMAGDLGRDAVVALAPGIKYDFIEDIDLLAFARWADTSGLDRRELAMIQPSYDFEKRPLRPRPIEPRYPLAEINLAFEHFETQLGACLETHLYKDRAYPEPWPPLLLSWDKDGKLTEMDFQLRRTPEALEACIREAAPSMDIVRFPHPIKDFRLIKIPRRKTDKGAESAKGE